MNFEEIVESEVKYLKGLKNRISISIFLVSFVAFFLLFFYIDIYKPGIEVTFNEKIIDAAFLAIMTSIIVFLLSCVVFDYKQNIFLDKKFKGVNILYSDFIRYKVKKSDEFVTEGEMNFVIASHLKKNKLKELANLVYLGTDKNKIERSQKNMQDVEESYVNNTKTINLSEVIRYFVEI